MDLIKIVRSLDQTGPGANGENLVLVWKSLTASAETSYHAVEESCLRWLLKSMNGSSEGAELLRRYPLTWAIIGCVFQRIPLFSLAKSLADRRFIAILQQTLKETSKPSTGSAAPGASKRKRSDEVEYDLASLRTLDGCVATGQTLLLSLKCLLDRLDSAAAGSSSDKIGAEHVRSLFCTSASEAVSIAQPLLQLCNGLIRCDAREDVEGRADWLQTLSTLWDFHLQAADDAVTVATHLFGPAAILLGKLENLSPKASGDVEEALRSRWSSDLQRFLHKNLVTPARSAFVGHKDESVLVTALEVTAGQADYSAPSFYLLAAREFNASSQQGLRKGNVDWMKRVFQLLETVLRRRPDRNQLARVILELADRHSVAVGAEDLGRVARDYALSGDATDWPLLASLVKCDPGVFHTSEDGEKLLEDVCQRSINGSLSEDDAGSASQVVRAIMQGYRTGRDFSGFLKLWFTQMQRAVAQGASPSSPWLALSQLEPKQDSVENVIEKELLPNQLLDVVRWTGQQDADASCVCIFSDILARGVRSEPFVDVVGRSLFDLVWQAKGPTSPLTALRWRVVSRTMTWASPEERSVIWDAVKPQLSEALANAPIKSQECFEAFKCCCQAWVSMTPDDEQLQTIAQIAKDFILRFTDEITKLKALKKDRVVATSDGFFDERVQFHEDTAFEHYLEYYLRGCSRLSYLLHSFKYDSVNFPLPLGQVLETRETEFSALEKRWDAILSNEVSLNLVDFSKEAIMRLLDAFQAAGQEKRWPSAQASMCMRALSRVPLDVLDREARERAMLIINKGWATMVKHAKKSDLASWKLSLSLATKLMSRPTFYEDMSFADLSRITDGMPEIPMDTSAGSAVALEMIERFSLLARASIKQMAEHVDDRSTRYFTESKKFVSDCRGQAADGDAKSGSLSVRITLLKAMVAEMGQSPGCRTHAELGKVLESAREALSESIEHTVGGLLSEKKLFKQKAMATDLGLFAVVDASRTMANSVGLSKYKQSTIRKLDGRSREAMEEGDVRGWAVQTFLRTHLAAELDVPHPTRMASLLSLPTELRGRLLEDYVDSITRAMEHGDKMLYLKGLIEENCDADGQILAIEHVANQLLDSSEAQADPGDFNLAVAQAELMAGLTLDQDVSIFVHRCRVLQSLLEKRPQSMTQWNIELTLGTVSLLASSGKARMPAACFIGLCKLVEVVIKKHRLRLEGHFHILLSTLQTLLGSLMLHKDDDAGANTSPVSSSSPSQKRPPHRLQPMANSYARLITLVCEPTAGAVSRTRQQSQLDSATDVAKRSAGRHMHLVLMHYVKLQLEATASSEVLGALEPAMNSIFDITPPEARKILNDGMDASGRAILREMFQRYTKFGKWSGV